MRIIDAYRAIDIIDEWLDSVGTVLVGKGLSSYGELIGCIEDTPTLTPPNEGVKDKNVPTNGPLTWEELEKLKNSPVYIEVTGVNSYWALVRDINDSGIWLMTVDDIDDYGSHCLYGKTWLAYRRPPEGEA